MRKKYGIEAMIGLGLRGRTFSDTVAIIDEAQNMSKASLQKVLTRFGKNCKVIVIGSNRQIDNPYITKYTNGLSVVLDAATKQTSTINMHVVPLTKVLRSDIAEWAENIFS
jgi:PhoH-like ATPase